MMVWGRWSRVDDRGLVRFVTPEARRWLPLDVSRFDLAGAPDERRRLIEAIYRALLAKDIRYALEAYYPAARQQPIRTPAEVLEAPREGTCLDLATLFCGLCLANELLPLLIVVQGHAFAAVSLTHGLREWDGYRPERERFEHGPLTDGAALRELIDTGRFLAIECTGFARSEALAADGQTKPEAPPESVGRVAGGLPFERAVAAGREQLDRHDRPFQFALDVAVAHYGWRIEPHPLEAAGSVALSAIYQAIAQAPAPLASHIRTREFQTHIDERTTNFVGRAFIFEGIDAALRDPAFPSGYVVIRGEPGIGKTALMAQLVKQRDYVHHFNIAPQNIRSVEAFLASVCAQLIVRYRLPHDALPPRATQDSGFFSELLQEAAECADERPIVILIDALDEAEVPPLDRDANRLYLPRSVPGGVYVVVTTREEHDLRLSVDRRRDIHLRDDDPLNQRDVAKYVHKFVAAHHVEMTPRLAAWGVNEAQFVDLLAEEKSQGNFMYVVYVLGDIREGRITKETLDDIRALPTGLRDYYQRHWRTMKAQDQERFERYYEPVVCTLATVREPVTLADLRVWTRRVTSMDLSPLRLREVIQEWRQFLNEDVAADGEARYRVYHASFQDFLREEVGLTGYHSVIAATALDKIPGFGRSP